MQKEVDIDLKSCWYRNLVTSYALVKEQMPKLFVLETIFKKIGEQLPKAVQKRTNTR